MIYYEKYDEIYNLYLKNDNTIKFLREIDDLIQENSKIFKILDEIINKFGNYNGKQLKDYVYSLNRTGIKIEFEIVELDKTKDILIVKK